MFSLPSVPKFQKVLLAQVVGAAGSSEVPASGFPLQAPAGAPALTQPSNAEISAAVIRAYGSGGIGALVELMRTRLRTDWLSGGESVDSARKSAREVSGIGAP